MVIFLIIYYVAYFLFDDGMEIQYCDEIYWKCRLCDHISDVYIIQTICYFLNMFHVVNFYCMLYSGSESHLYFVGI